MAKNNRKPTGSNATVVMKKTGNRGGRQPGTAATNAGLLPYGAQTGGQTAADPVGVRKQMQQHLRRAIGWNEH